MKLQIVGRAFITSLLSNLRWLFVCLLVISIGFQVHGQTISNSKALNLGTKGDQMFPAWEPYGHYLAYQSNQNGNWDIFIYNLEMNKITQVTFSADDEIHPVWVPGENALVYDSKRNGEWHIYYKDLNSGLEKPLFDQKVEAREASFTPSRHLVAFSGFDPSSNHWQIFTYDLVYHNLNLLTMIQGDAHFPVFAQDGKELAYHVHDFTGNNYIQLTNWFGDFYKVLRRGRGKVSWAPGSWRMFFISMGGDSLSIVSIGQDGSDFQKLLTSKVPISSPAVSPDGKELAFSKQTADGWKIFVTRIPN